MRATVAGFVLAAGAAGCASSTVVDVSDASVQCLVQGKVLGAIRLKNGELDGVACYEVRLRNERGSES